MLKSQRLSLFEETVMTASERDNLIESLICEAEDDLLYIDDGYMTEASGDVISNVWEKIKKIFKTIIEKISSIFKKKVVQEVDENEEVEVNEKEFSKIKSFLAAVKKILSAPIHVIGKAVKSGKGPLILAMSLVTGFAIGNIITQKNVDNREIKARNKFRVKKGIALKLMKEAEDEAKHSNAVADKIEAQLNSMKKPGKIAITKNQKTNKNKYNRMKNDVENLRKNAKNANDKASFMYSKAMENQKGLNEKSGGHANASDDGEEVYTYAKSTAQFFSSVGKGMNAVTSALSSIVFAKGSKKEETK